MLDSFVDELKLSCVILQNLHQRLFKPFLIFRVSFQQMHSLVAWIFTDGFDCFCSLLRTVTLQGPWQAVPAVPSKEAEAFDERRPASP